MLAEDPSAYAPVHMLKYSGEFREFIWHIMANLSKNLG
jgi:hypothetical protein